MRAVHISLLATMGAPSLLHQGRASHAGAKAAHGRTDAIAAMPVRQWGDADNAASDDTPTNGHLAPPICRGLVPDAR